MSLQPTKTPEQIEAMRQGGQILAQLLVDLKNYVQPGMTGCQIDAWLEQEILKRGAEVTYKDPAEGDVAKFDLVITYHDMKVDSAFTMVVGEEPSGSKKHLLNNVEKSLYAGIAQVKAGAHIGDISSAIEKVLKKAKLGIVLELVGHGVGQKMHMDPEVPNFGHKGTGPVLSVGDTIAIEPMASLGKGAITTASDGWTIAMRDGSLSAHFEHTVLVTANGCEILTKLK